MRISVNSLAQTGRNHGGPRIARARIVPLCCAVVLILLNCAQRANAAALQTGTPYRTSGGIAVPVWLSPNANDQVASLQFQFSYDHNDFYIASVAAGPAASSAGKDVVFAEHGDTATIIVAGFNQDVFEGGLVATLFFSPNDNAQDLGAVGINAPVFSDPDGDPVQQHTPAADDPDTPGSTSSNPENNPSSSPTEEEEVPETAAGNAVSGTDTASPNAQNRYGSPYFGDGLGGTTNRLGEQATKGGAAPNANGTAGLPLSGQSGGASTFASGSNASQNSFATVYGVSAPGVASNLQSSARPATNYRHPAAMPSTKGTAENTSPRTTTQSNRIAQRPGMQVAEAFNGNAPYARRLANAAGQFTPMNSPRNTTTPWGTLFLMMLASGAMAAAGGWWWHNQAPRARR